MSRSAAGSQIIPRSTSYLPALSSANDGAVRWGISSFCKELPKQVAYIRQIPDNEATGPLKRIYDAGSARSGSVANIIKVQSLDARTCQASMGFYMNLMKSDNALSPARREMLASVVSGINGCYY